MISMEREKMPACPACRASMLDGGSTLTHAAIFDDPGGAWRVLAICQFCGVVHDGTEEYDSRAEAENAFSSPPRPPIASGVRVRWRTHDLEAVAPGPREGTIVAWVPPFRDAARFLPQMARGRRRFTSIAKRPRYLIEVRNGDRVEYLAEPAKTIENQR